MDKRKLIQIGIIIFSVFLKSAIFQYFGWEYDILADEPSIIKMLSHILAVVAIIFVVSFVMQLFMNKNDK